jgi:hypothetical protein
MVKSEVVSLRGEPTPGCPVFEHKGVKVEAVVKSADYGVMHLELHDDFFKMGVIEAFSKEDADMISKAQGFTRYRTYVSLFDKNGFLSSFRYGDKELEDADTQTTKGSAIDPRRAFAFWVSLSKALREDPSTPQPLKKNLEEIAGITSLEGYIKQHPANHASLRVELPDISKEYADPKYF